MHIFEYISYLTIQRTVYLYRMKILSSYSCQSLIRPLEVPYDRRTINNIWVHSYPVSQGGSNTTQSHDDMQFLFDALNKIVVKLGIRPGFIKLFQSKFFSMGFHFINERGKYFHAEDLWDIPGVEHTINIFQDKIFLYLIITY